MASTFVPDRETDKTEKLLSVVSQLLSELHPQNTLATDKLKLNSSLDRDLGLDSLSRVELMIRLERAFDVDVPGDLLADAETVEDLLLAILPAHLSQVHVLKGEHFQDEQEDVTGLPANAETLLEMLDWHLSAHPERTHIYLYGEDSEPEKITYADLHKGAKKLPLGFRPEI